MSVDSDNGSKIKLIVILVVVLAIAGLVVAGALTSKSSTPAPVAQTPAPTPAPAQTAQVTSVQTSDAIQPILSNKLPFAISAKHSADLEVQGAALIRGKVEMPKGESGNIDRLANSDNQSWVIMPMQANHKRSLLGQSVATAQRVLIPTLAVDGAGFIEPVGFAYEDATKRIVQLEPDFGLRGISQTPELFAARDDQQLWLIYRVPSGSYITQMVMGKQVVTVWSPPLQVK
jgi:hypothetical protein